MTSPRIDSHSQQPEVDVGCREEDKGRPVKSLFVWTEEVDQDGRYQDHNSPSDNPPESSHSDEFSNHNWNEDNSGQCRAVGNQPNWGEEAASPNEKE